MFSARDTTAKDLSWINDDNYHLVQFPQQLDELRHHLLRIKSPPAIDFETDGLSTVINKIVGVAISPEAEHSYYIPIRHKCFENLDLGLFAEDLKQMMMEHKWIAFNSIFEQKMAKANFDIWLPIENDVMIDMWLTDSDRGPSSQRRRLGLAYLCRELLGIQQLEMQDFLPKGVYDFSLVDQEEDALLYAGGDTDCTLRLNAVVRKRIEALKLEKLSKLETKVTLPVAKMEFNGIYIDQAYAESLDMTQELLRLEDEIAVSIGQHINPNSPQQVAEALYDKLGLPQPKADSRSVDERSLSRIKSRHEVVPLILQYRDLEKLQGSFLSKMREVASEDGRLHGSFSPFGTRSGRFSSSGGVGRGGIKLKVNGQQLPKVDRTARVNVRRTLSCSKGWYWLSSDFKQVEYRVLAYDSGERSLIEAYAKGVDFHVKTASMMLKVPVEMVDFTKRKKGKTLNFAIVFGMTDAGLAMALGISIKEAAALKKSYFDNLPYVSKLIAETKAFIRKHGYVRTAFGRVRHFDLTGLDAKQSESLLMAGFNTRIQGTAADINKLAIVRIDAALTKEYGGRVRLLSTIHDELNMEVSDEIPLNDICPFVRENMSVEAGILPGWLDFPVSIEVARNFGDLVEIPSEIFKKAKTPEEAINLLGIKEELDAYEEDSKQICREAVPRRCLTLSAPSVVISLGDDPQDDSVRLLQDAVDTASGFYTLVLESSGRHFLCEGREVNPSPTFVKTVSGLGFKVEVNRPSKRKTFDPTKLSFK